MQIHPCHSRFVGDSRRYIGAITILCALTVACSKRDEGPARATPAVSLPSQATAGQSADVTYRFAVAPDAPAFSEDYVVFVHAFDESGSRVWTSDHEPPTPTSQWKPGAVIEYTRPMAIPRNARGPCTVEIGLYSPNSQERLTLSGESRGRRAYRVGLLDVRRSTNAPSAVYTEGFYPVETPEDAQGVEWRWSGRSGTIWLPNPKQDLDVILELDQPVSGAFGEPQRVEVRHEAKVLDSFALIAGRREVRRMSIPGAETGSSPSLRLTLSVDRTFVPSKQPNGIADDHRELGVRIFDARREPRPP